jgi:pimeloyl-ACP methyl ester carboxylesterase
VALSCSRTGSGRPFVWCHGLTSSRANEDERGLLDWSAVVEVGRELLRYDAPGHGMTGGPADPAAYGWAQLAVDLLGLLDDLGLERTSAGGASMGCATVLHAAVRAPERFDRLVLACPPTAWETRPAQAEGYEKVAAFVEAKGKEALLRASRAVPRPAIFESEPESTGADIPEELLPAVFRGAAASDLPAPADIEQIAVPALVLAWDTDPGHPVSTATRLAELLPDASLHVAATVGDIRAWGPLVADFLA